MSGIATRTGGTSSTSASAASAHSSAPSPIVIVSSCTTHNRRVLASDERIVSRSSGASVRKSITSTSMPSVASVSAAASDSCSIIPYASTVASRPSRATCARPIGTT